MSEANVEVIRKIYACFDNGDVAGFLECMADDIAFDHRGNENPESPINKLFQGKDGVQEFVDTVLSTQDVLAHDVHDFFTSGDKVALFGFYKGRVKATGKEFASNWAQIWTMKDGLAIAWKLYFNFTAEALAYQQ